MNCRCWFLLFKYWGVVVCDRDLCSPVSLAAFLLSRKQDYSRLHITMSVHNSDRVGPAPLKNLNAFNLPKLKKFPARAEAKAVGSSTAEGAENRNSAALFNPPADAASPVAEQTSSQVPAVKPTTVRKSKRQAKSRPSEITVYYDAVQSPDEVGTVSKQKPRQARAAKVPSKQVAAAPVQSSLPAAVDVVADTHHFDTQPEPMDAEDEPLSLNMLEEVQPAVADAHKASRRSRQQIDLLSEDDAAAEGAATTATRRRSRNSDKDSSEPAAPSGRQAGADQQQQQPAKAAEGFRDGQEIFKYMQQLAENAEQLLPQDDEQEQKKRGRGRAKKDLRLVDALHQSWKGKSYYERLQELTRQEVEEEDEQAGAAAEPEYRLRQLNAPATAADADSRPGSSKPLSSSQQQQQQPANTAIGRKRRTTRPSSRAGSADSDTDVDDTCNDAEAAAGEPAANGTAAAAAAGPSKRRATAGSAAAVGRGVAAAKAGKPAAGTATTTAAAAAANKGRKSTILGGVGGINKSPFLNTATTGSRPLSSKANGSLAWESTPAGAAAGGNLAERPPWSVGGSAAATGAAGAAGAGVTAAAGTAKADRSAIQRLQAVLDAKTEELTTLKDQLKESQDLVAKLRADQKAHPKAIAQLEKQKQALEKKVEAAERRQTAVERENEGLQEKLAKQETERAALQEQLSKSDKELKALRLKLKQSTAKLEKCQAMGQKMQEMGAALAAEAQPIWIE